jgi:hypothetical protein
MPEDDGQLNSTYTGTTDLHNVTAPQKLANSFFREKRRESQKKGIRLALIGRAVRNLR